MKKGFTIVEVSILFVIFLIVAFLVAPLSLDDTLIAKNTLRWKTVQQDFDNIFYSINMQKEKDNFDFKQTFEETMKVEIKGSVEPYRILFMNGTYPNNSYRFNNYKQTLGHAVIAYKLFDEPQGDLQGLLMYDVNGSQGPNTWGKDVFGYNIYSDKFEPFCKKDSVPIQKQECAKSGTGLCCSNYLLIGGSID